MLYQIEDHRSTAHAGGQTMSYRGDDALLVLETRYEYSKPLSVKQPKKMTGL